MSYETVFSFSELNDVFSYQPETGKILWAKKVASKVIVGTEAGSAKPTRVNADGIGVPYRYIRYRGVAMSGSRLAWLLHYGEWPSGMVDFKDGDTLNLRIDNLVNSLGIADRHDSNGLSVRKNGGELTQERLREMLSYDSETGIFTWIATGRGIRTGRQAGSVDNKYRHIVIDGVDYLAHRLAWFYTHNEWPRLIRFQNDDQDDCRIDNLRDGFKTTTKYNHRDPEDKAAYSKEWRDAHPDIVKERGLMRSFGLSLAEYAAMVATQDNKCAICERSETQMRDGKIKALAVDHCHSTGKIRGLLCVSCNQAIGKMEDDRNLLLAAIRYLDKHAETNVAPIKRPEKET